ncbi:MAG: efflux RND transporter periplasmic adaptor subunit [Alphaproteobacteria bacterium]|nr:efflux RND transporter periplasmic adaptor subunit [Alphaproteobacteria bacterium]
MTLKIGTPVATTIQAVLVERGDRVAKGQVIARLDSAIEAADLDLIKLRATSTTEIASRTVRVELARTELNRAERLLETNNVPRQKVDELRAALRVAREDLAQAELNHKVAQLELARALAVLEQRTIKSPIDAIVVQRNLGPGEYAHQDSFIVELAAVSPLFVEAYPPVRYFDSIRKGDSGTVTPIGSPDRSFRVAVQVADPVFDAGSGTFGLRLALPNENGALPAGLRCRVTFDVKEIPGEAAASASSGLPR